MVVYGGNNYLINFINFNYIGIKMRTSSGFITVKTLKNTVVS